MKPLHTVRACKYLETPLFTLAEIFTVVESNLDVCRAIDGTAEDNACNNLLFCLAIPLWRIAIAIKVLTKVLALSILAVVEIPEYKVLPVFRKKEPLEVIVAETLLDV